MSSSSASISIVCVYNKLEVREQCLDRSIEALLSDSDSVEYLPVNNVDGSYATAGAALNHGVSLAKNDVVVFAHQDVYLHSLVALKSAAAQLQSGDYGVLGAIGRGSDGRMIGRIRDRIFLTGERVHGPTEVDSLDEVLFMAPREQLLSEPLAVSPDLAWHAYAVEYGLRMRRRGLRTGVADIPLTHNSLSVNIDRLDKAHQAVATTYRDLLPVRTTCGTITTNLIGAEHQRAWFSKHRWRYRWLRESMALQRIRKTIAETVSVIVDLRHDIDAAIERAPGNRLYVVNCSTGDPFTAADSKPVELSRGSGTVVFSDRRTSRIPAEISSSPPGSWILVTNLSPRDMRFLQAQNIWTSCVLGFYHDTGPWLLLGPELADLPESWRSARATPLDPRNILISPLRHSHS